MLNYQAVSTLGADFAKNIGSYGVRGEAAYIRTQDEHGDDPLTKNSYVSAVLGVDRTFFSDFGVNVQYVHRHAMDWKSAKSVSDPNLRRLAEQVQILALQSSAEFAGASLRLNYKMLHDTLMPELTLYGWFNNGFFRPKITYAFSDQLQGIVGGEVYAGSDDSLFGRLRSTSSAFLEFRYLF